MRGRNSGFGSSPVLRAAGAVLVLLFCAGAVRAQQTFGYVLEVRGDWLVNGGAKLSKGGSVSVGAVITAADPSDGGSYIVISDRAGNIYRRLSCGNGDCARPFSLPASAASGKSYLSRVVDGMMGIFYKGEPNQYRSVVSRGADLREAVLKLDAQKLDLGRVFENMPGDRYVVRFEKIEDGRRPAPKPVEVEYEWDSQRRPPLGAQGLRPGLYRVTVREVRHLEEDNEAWVLVTSPKGYAKAAQSFDAAVNVTRRWEGKVREDSKRQFLRAALEFITTQSPQ